MKIFGSWSELVSLIFRKNSQAITLQPNTATTYTASRTVELPVGDAAHELVGTAATQTLTNKTIDASSNTISNIDLTSDVTGTLPVANGGTGQTTANAALNALLPSQAGNAGRVLSTDGTDTNWATSPTPALTDGDIFIGNGSDVATARTVSGDITLTNTGVASIASGVIVNADINASAAIAYSKLALTGSILNADVNASAAIAGTKISPDFGNQQISTSDSVFVQTSSASQTASSSANHLVLESSTNAGLSLLCGPDHVGRIAFGDIGDPVAGRIDYNFLTNALSLGTNGVASRVTIDSSGNVGVGTSLPGFISGYSKYISLASGGSGEVPSFEMFGNRGTTAATVANMEFINNGSSVGRIRMVGEGGGAQRGTMELHTGYDSAPTASLTVSGQGLVTIGKGSSNIHVINGQVENSAPTNGTGGATPAQAQTYLRVQVNGTVYKIPLYVNS